MTFTFSIFKNNFNPTPSNNENVKRQNQSKSTNKSSQNIFSNKASSNTSIDLFDIKQNISPITSPFRKTAPLEENLLLQKCDIQNLAKSMIKMIDAKDDYTGKHSQIVKKQSEVFAKRLGLSPREIEIIGLGSGFHDLGKIGVPESILNSENPLTESEFEKIKQHPEIGAKILDDIPAFKESVSKIVKHHHENWDGTGYPDNLKGEDIPIGARIVAIVDSYQAMTSDRPYRKGMPSEKAISILQDGVGKQWDPSLVSKFIEIIPFLPKG